MGLEIHVNASQNGMSSNMFQQMRGGGFQKGNMARSSSAAKGGKGMLSLIKSSNGIGPAGKGGSMDIVI